jgi:hypothetical protein
MALAAVAAMATANAGGRGHVPCARAVVTIQRSQLVRAHTCSGDAGAVQ